MRSLNTLEERQNYARLVLRAYRLGAICPAEAWNQMGDILAVGDALDFLQSLSSESQLSLRKIYWDRPHSFDVLSEHAWFQLVRNWLEETRDTI